MSQEKPLVSIITICYNHEKYLRQALDSILAQQADTYRMEIIVADDASQDGTSKIIEQYAHDYPELIRPIARKVNIGIQPNLIDALRQAKGEYITMCEGDDFWSDKTKLARQIEVMEKDKTLDICFHPTRVFFDDGLYPDTKYPEKRTGFTPEELMIQNYIPTNAVMYRRRDYSKIRSDLMPFDWYLHAYHLRGGTIGFINRTMSAYRRHSGGAWWNSHKNTTLFWKDNGPSMLEILSEFRHMFAESDSMTEAIRKGEYRVLREMVLNGVEVDYGLINEEVRGVYFNNISKDYSNLSVLYDSLKKTDLEKTLQFNQQITSKNEEIELLRGDLSSYINELAESQQRYDMLRQDLKNPSRLFVRLLKRAKKNK